MLMTYRPTMIRRRSIKQIWYMMVAGMCCTFILESANYLYKTIPDLPTESGEGLRDVLLLERGDDDIPTRPVHRHVDKQLPKTSKWIVVLSQKGCDVTHLTMVRGWDVVVVGNNPKGCTGTKECTYIDSALERTLGYRIIQHIKKGSGERKMIGYMFALSKGATAIYDVDCDVIPKFHNIEFQLSGNTSGLLFTGGPLFNPFAHFGFPMLSPRGLPNNAQSVQGQGRYRILETRVPIIQQGQVNIHFRTRDAHNPRKSGISDVSFDRSSPPVFISGNRYGPINSFNTIFLYDAFWALFLPAKSHGDSDMIRGYISQCLLNHINGCVGYMPPNAYTSSNNYYRFIDQTRTGAYYEELISALSKWKCDSRRSFFKCATDLIDNLTRLHILSKGDLKLFKAWVMDLKSVGYAEPILKTSVNPVSNESHWNPQVVYNSPKVIPSEMDLLKGHTKTNTFKYPLDKIHTICPNLSYTISHWKNPPITDIILVVILNYKFLIKSIPNMEFIHRMYFRHILYCGPDFKGLTQLLKQTNMHHIIYVNGVDTWFFTYQCIVHAASMNLNVKGYLYIGDDILLNTWNVVNLPRDKFWMTKGNPPLDRSLAKHPWWYYWNKPIGRKAVNRFMDEVLQEAKKNPNDTMLKNFIGMYDRNINISRTLHSSIDIFYAPAVYNKQIVRFGKLFRKHQTLLGLVVPMLRVGLVNNNDFVTIKGKSLWKKDREKNINAFNKNSFYLHPFKMIKDVSEEHGRRFFCETYMDVAIRQLKMIKRQSH